MSISTLTCVHCAALLHASYVLCRAIVSTGELGGAVVPGQQSDRCARRRGCVDDAYVLVATADGVGVVMCVR